MGNIIAFSGKNSREETSWDWTCFLSFKRRGDCLFCRFTLLPSSKIFYHLDFAVVYANGLPSPFLKYKFIYLFIYLFLAALGLSCCSQAFL